MSAIAIIPARGGSKGIPRKNMRLMHGKPLIAYAIENALASKNIDAVAVTSDSDEILDFASRYEGVICINRDGVLASDEVTLDPVIHDALVKSEDQLGERFDLVVTLQPTSPLLQCSTIDAGIEAFAESGKDALISVTNDPHLTWGIAEDGAAVPNYEKRVNRQQLPPSYKETGGMVVSRRECVTPESRLGDSIHVYEVPVEESVDIDTRDDWAMCESMLSRRRIVFRVDGYKSRGLGHVFRALALAYALTEHDVLFVCNGANREGVDKLKAAHMNVVELECDESFIDWAQANHPDIIVHDLLDTDADYMARLKGATDRLVTFEDLGSGASEADAVINAIYEGDSSLPRAFMGKDYVCLRDEFLTNSPAPFSSEVQRILVTFGGTDPLGLTERLYAIAQQINTDGVQFEFDFILGPGYSGPSLQDVDAEGIQVHANIARMSDHMRAAQLAVSSQGRTTFELASMGVPTIVLAQNEREQLHTFAQMDNGFINLGLGSRVSDEDILSTILWLSKASSVRQEMHDLMLASDLRKGIYRVKRIILGKEV